MMSTVYCSIRNPLPDWLLENPTDAKIVCGKIVDAARDEDEARAGAREPLRESYLYASIFTITPSLR